MRHKSIKRTAVLLTAALLLTAAVPAASVRAESDEDFATSEQLDELEQLRQREAELAARQGELENDMAVVRQDVAALQDESYSLDLYLSELQAEGVILQEDYERLSRELEAARAAVNLAVSEYDEAAKEVEAKEEEYQDRLVAMYKRSKQSKLEVLLSSDGMTGFFTNLELLGVIGRSDQQVLEDLTAARETAEAKKQAAEQSKLQYEIFVADKQEEIKVLAGGIADTEKEISDLETEILNRSADLDYYAGLYNDAAAEESALRSRRDNIEGEIRAQAEATRAAWAEATRAAEEERARIAAEATRQAEAEASRKAEEEAAAAAAATEAAQEEEASEAPAAPSAPSGSGMTFPAPGNTGISSYYGWRTYPLNPARRDFHSGLDFPANFNDPVVAALDGTVVMVSYPYPDANYGGWGLANRITIQHDNGLQTVYGHLKSIYVSPGQRVSRGELIAAVGSTGYSTGPHLHFEVRQPGNPNAGLYNSLNPYPYLFG